MHIFVDNLNVYKNYTQNHALMNILIKMLTCLSA